MPKTIKLESHLSSEELGNRYRKAHDPVLRSHYQILWLISEGKTTTQVMEVTGYSRGWIQQLARRYNRYGPDRKSTRLNSSHANISYAVFCLKKKTHPHPFPTRSPSRIR